MNYNNSNNISFNDLYIMIMKAKNAITKKFHGWNDRDYLFLVNEMNLEKSNAVRLVKKINSSNISKVQFLRDFMFLNTLAIKYLRESNVGKKDISITQIELDQISQMLKYNITS